MKAQVRSSQDDSWAEKGALLQDEAAQVHSSAPWDGSLESCQAQRSCKGDSLLSRKPWWPEEFLLPRQLHELRCCTDYSDSGDHSEMWLSFSYCTWPWVMESGGSCHHRTPLSGSMKPVTVLSLSPPGPSAGKGGWNVVIVSVPGKVGLGFQGFLNIAAPVHFVPRHVFILHFCGFLGKVAQSTVLLSVVGQWWGQKGARESCQMEPVVRGARKTNSQEKHLASGTYFLKKHSGEQKHVGWLRYEGKPCSCLATSLAFQHWG